MPRSSYKTDGSPAAIANVDDARENWLVKGGSFWQEQFSQLKNINTGNVSRLLIQRVEAAENRPIGCLKDRAHALAKPYAAMALGTGPGD